MIQCQNNNLVMGFRWNSYMILFMGISWEFHPLFHPDLFMPAGDLQHIVVDHEANAGWWAWDKHQTLHLPMHSIEIISICHMIRCSQIFPSQPSQFKDQLPRSFRSWRWCSVSWTLKTSQVFPGARSCWWSLWGSGASRGRRSKGGGGRFRMGFGCLVVCLLVSNSKKCWMMLDVFLWKKCLTLILTLVLFPKQCGHTWVSCGRG